MRLFAIGNALVDDEIEVSDSILSANGLPKGHMQLIDKHELAAYRSAFGAPLRRCGGGSAANSAAAYAGFGGEAHFCGRVAVDAVGQWFLQDLKRYGVAARSIEDSGGGISGQCLVLITPDAERTMLTYLGVSADLREADLDEQALAGCDIVYLEGYMASSPVSTETCTNALRLARASGLETALSLSDTSMIQHFRSQLKGFLADGVTHVFCNVQEALLMADTDRLDVATTLLGEVAEYLHITLGDQGSLCMNKGLRTSASAPATIAVDTTGAGDMYAAAALYAHSRGADPQHMTSFGNLAAAHVVGLYGARLENPADYAEFSREVGR